MIFQKLVIGSEHAGWAMRKDLEKYLASTSLIVNSVGAMSQDSFDYPLAIPCVVQQVLSGAGGILICGSGIGMSIGANRYKGVRAALCHNAQLARLARQHNDANILVLGARFIDFDEAKACVDAFLTTSFEGGRHSRRLELLEGHHSC